MWDIAPLRAAAERTMTPGNLQRGFFLNGNARAPCVTLGNGLVRVTSADIRACEYHDAPDELEYLVRVTNEALYFGAHGRFAARASTNRSRARTTHPTRSHRRPAGDEFFRHTGRGHVLRGLTLTERWDEDLRGPGTVRHATARDPAFLSRARPRRKGGLPPSADGAARARARPSPAPSDMRKEAGRRASAPLG